MNVVWKYLDKRAGAVSALKDFGSMKFIVENTDDEIKAAYDKMSSCRGVRYDGMHMKNLNTVENRIINGIEEIDVLKERYRQAVEYMDWFVPAWEQLSEDDRYVLDIFYCKDNEYGSSVVDGIAEHFHIERASAYRRKNRALERLTILLFGKA